MLWIDLDDDRTITWHVGQPLPPITKRVITFQADGHELTAILNALKSTITNKE